MNRYGIVFTDIVWENDLHEEPKNEPLPDKISILMKTKREEINKEGVVKFFSFFKEKYEEKYGFEIVGLKITFDKLKPHEIKPSLFDDWDLVINEKIRDWGGKVV